jgi:signal peptidase
MKRLIDTIKVIISVILIVIGIGVAFIALPIFGNQALIVRSGSMLPTIDVGTIIVIRPLESLISPISATPKYEKGDIIAFRSEKNSNTIITHRVTSYEIFNGTVFYKTKGDANEEIDNWQVDEKNIIGKSFITIPQAGKVLAFAKSKYGFPILIILPSLIVILMESLNIFKEIKKNRPEKDAVIGNTQSSYFFTFGSRALKVLIPVIALGLIIPTTLAFLKDTETSSGNVLQAAAVFPTSTQSVTPTLTGSITPSPTSTPTIASNLVINEILYDTSTNQNISGQGGSNRGEFLEIYNPTFSSVNVNNWIIEDNTSSETLSNFTIPAGGYLIVTGATEAEFEAVWTVPISTQYFQSTGGTIGNGFANDGDSVILKDSSNTIIDQISWGNDTTILNPAPIDLSSGHSLERNPDGLDTNTAADFVDRNPPTPGT